MKDIEKKLIETIKRYVQSGIAQQVDYEKFYLYSLITHSTAIEGSTLTEVENQLLFDEGIAAKGRQLNEQLMNIDLKDAYLFGLDLVRTSKRFTPQLLCELSAKVMRRTGSEYSTLWGTFNSSKGDLRLCNVSAGVGGVSYLSFQKVPKAIDDFCCWLNDELSSIDKNDIAKCYRLSFEAHFRLVTIHPWVDGNGRTTRLLMNIVQRQLNLVPSVVTKDAKGEYIQALIDSRENDDSSIIQDLMMSQHIANLENRILQYQQRDGKTANGGNVAVMKLSDRQLLIISLIIKQNDITSKQMAVMTGIAHRTIERELSILQKLNFIKHVGSPRTGSWSVIKPIEE